MSARERSLSVILSRAAIIAPQNRAAQADSRAPAPHLIFLHLCERRRVPSSPTAVDLTRALKL